MTSYWIRENGLGGYCEGDLPDGAYDEETCILVPQKPELWSLWNNDTRLWIDDPDSKKNYLRNIRDNELHRTDKYMLSDYFKRFPVDKQLRMTTYRDLLRDFTSVDPFDLPPCPDFIIENKTQCQFICSKFGICNGQ